MKLQASATRTRSRRAAPTLQPAFVPVLDKLADALGEPHGHRSSCRATPTTCRSARRTYPSNWVLSSARAASVVHHLAEADLDDPTRIEIRAYSDTRPVVENDTVANRATNRRVEIDIGVAPR